MTEKGLHIRLWGFHDKAPLLYKKILSTLQKKDLEPQEFLHIQEKLLQEYADFFASPLYQQSSAYCKQVLFPDNPTPMNLKKGVEKATFEDFAKFLQTAFSSIYVDALLIGNLTPDEAKKSYRQMTDALSKKSYSRTSTSQRELSLQNELPLQVAIPCEQNGESLLFLAIESAQSTPKERALGELLMTAIRPFFFQELRTKQQTGYALFSLYQEIEGRLFHIFVIQSSKYSPEELRWRCEIFLADWCKELELLLPSSSWAHLKSSLVEKYERGSSSLEEFGKKMERLHTTYQREFDRDKKTESALKETSYEDFVHHAHNTLGRHNLRRLSIEIESDESPALYFHKENPKFLPYQNRERGKAP